MSELIFCPNSSFFLLYLFMNDWVQMNSPVIKMGQIALKVKFIKK